MRQGWATAGDGTAIAYQRDGAGRPLVLLAGQSNDHTWWGRVRGDFGRATITVDHRGTGASGKPDTPYSTRGFAEDVVAVLDEVGVDDVDLYGTSMGGRVAQWLAALHPDRVRRLVLGCTSPGGPHAVERSRAVRKALAQVDKGKRQEALLDLMYTPSWRAANPGPYRVLGSPAMPPHALRLHFLASEAHDAWDALPGITAPTLVLHGSDDLMTPVDNAALLVDRIPDARAHVFPGARHAYFDECRSEASPMVVDFLDRPTKTDSTVAG